MQILTKTKFLSYIVTIVLLLNSCNKNKTNCIPNTNQNNINELITQNTLDNANAIILPIPTQEVEIETGLIPSQEKVYNDYKNTFVPSKTIDLDLSTMTSTMIFSLVFDMLIEPEKYEDQNIKIKGNFVVYISKETNEKYYSIIIPDATQCCQQGIPFIWFGEEKKYPQDFPKIGQEVTLIGKYKTTYTDTGIMTTFIQANEIY